jgi:uncharacterized cupredoxin-like copper-binding protein
MLLPSARTHGDGETNDMPLRHVRRWFPRYRLHGMMVLLAAVSVALAACGSSSKTSSGAAATSSPTSPAPAAATTPASHDAMGTQVTATLTEFHIALSQMAMKPGTYTFMAMNAGHTVHALEITGPGVSGAKTPSLQPGQTAQLTVTLQAGTYDVFCPIPGHKQLGMNMNLAVGSSSAASPPPAPAPTAPPATAPPTTKASGGSSSWG